MLNLNKSYIAGNITHPPTIGTTASGITAAAISIAINERTKDGKTSTTYMDVKAYGNLAKFTEQYLAQGRNILVEGRLRMDSWQDKKTGETRRKFYLLADNLHACDTPQRNRDYTDPTAAPSQEASEDIPW